MERGNLTVADVERRVVGGAFVRLDPERRARELRVRERQPNKVELPSLVAVLAYSSKGKLATHLKQLPGSGEISPSWSPHRPLARPRLQPQRRRVLVVEGRRAFCARRTTPPPPLSAGGRGLVRGSSCRRRQRRVEALLEVGQLTVVVRKTVTLTVTRDGVTSVSPRRWPSC